MTPQQWDGLIHAIRAANDTAQLVAATLIPIMYIYVFVVHRELIAYHFRSGDWRRRLPDPGPERLVPVLPSWWPRGRAVRQLEPGEPTMVMRDMAGKTTLYASGPRPPVAEARIRLGWLRASVTCEREVRSPNQRSCRYYDPAQDRPSPRAAASSPVRRPGRHRVG